MGEIVNPGFAFVFSVLLAIREGELRRGGYARMKPTLFTIVGQRRG
jgi:hypothetical protein